MRCLFSTCFSVLINGVSKGLIQPERELRQGCPLSPCLFILCAKTFSNLLVQAERKQLIRGLRFAKDITISNLLFADDSLVFVRASMAECKHLRKVFDCYVEASRQIFNFDKSSMFFSRKIVEGQVAVIKDIFKLNVVTRYEKYLRLPSMIGKKKMGFFSEVKLKILNKISCWQHKKCSSRGKEILINAAAQAVPAYAMSVFKLPKGLYDEIQRAYMMIFKGLQQSFGRVQKMTNKAFIGQGGIGLVSQKQRGFGV